MRNNIGIMMCIMLWISVVIMESGIGWAEASWKGAYEPDDNTVALWHFDEGKGQRVRDASRYNNHGDIDGPVWVEGKFGKALRFDGVDDYVYCGDDSSLEVTNQFTIEAWIKWNGTGKRYQRIVEKDGAYCLQIRNKKGQKGRILLGINEMDDNDEWVLSRKTQPNKWTHVAGVYDGSKLKIYINGRLEKEKATSVKSIEPGGDVYISYAGYPAEALFSGIIDEVRISNKARLFSERQKEIVSPLLKERPKTFSDYLEAAKQGKLARKLKIVKVEASNYASGYPPELIVDENRDDRDKCWRSGAPNPQWFELDLGSEQTFDGITLITFWGDGRYYQYMIEVSSNKKDWKRIIDETNNKDPATEFGKTYLFDPVRARYIKATFTYISVHSGAHVVEAEVFKRVKSPEVDKINLAASELFFLGEREKMKAEIKRLEEERDLAKIKGLQARVDWKKVDRESVKQIRLKYKNLPDYLKEEKFRVRGVYANARFDKYGELKLDILEKFYFNTIHSWTIDRFLLDMISSGKRYIKVYFYLGGQKNHIPAPLRENALNAIKELKDSPNLLGWGICDEPNPQAFNHTSDIMRDNVEKIKELDKSHKLIINVNVGAYASAVSHMYFQMIETLSKMSFDQISTNPYCVPLRKLEYIGKVIDLARENMRDSQELFLVPQAHKQNSADARRPTAEEVRIMTYYGLAHGTDGEIYFQLDHNYEGKTEIPSKSMMDENVVPTERMYEIGIINAEMEILKYYIGSKTLVRTFSKSGLDFGEFSKGKEKLLIVIRNPKKMYWSEPIGVNIKISVDGTNFKAYSLSFPEVIELDSSQRGNLLSISLSPVISTDVILITNNMDIVNWARDIIFLYLPSVSGMATRELGCRYEWVTKEMDIISIIRKYSQYFKNELEVLEGIEKIIENAERLHREGKYKESYLISRKGTIEFLKVFQKIRDFTDSYCKGIIDLKRDPTNEIRFSIDSLARKDARVEARVEGEYDSKISYTEVINGSFYVRETAYLPTYSEIEYFDSIYDSKWLAHLYKDGIWTYKCPSSEDMYEKYMAENKFSVDLPADTILIEAEDFDNLGSYSQGRWTPSKGIYGLGRNTSGDKGIVAWGRSNPIPVANKKLSLPSSGIYYVWARVSTQGRKNRAVNIRVKENGQIKMEATVAQRENGDGDEPKLVWYRIGKDEFLSEMEIVIDRYDLDNKNDAAVDCFIITKDSHFTPYD